MLTTLMVSLVFFAVGTVVLASGIFTLQSNHKASANRMFFALSTSVAIWSTGMALSIITKDAAASERYRRVAAIGWSTVYVYLLQFILVITGYSSKFKKRWQYVLLYLPATFTLYAFVFPNPINPHPYHLKQTNFGWLNVAENNVCDWIFYIYYISYTIIGLYLLYRWGMKSSDRLTKKKSRIIRISLISALILGTITDVILSSMFAELPQLAPVIMLIPALAIYHVLHKDSFGITEGTDKKTSYMILFVNVLVYIILSALHELLSDTNFTIGSIVFTEPVINGIIVQIQMFLSIYLVLMENRPGYIAALMMSIISLLSAISFFIRSGSTTSFPGIIGYINALMVILLIRAYKEKNSAYIKKINTQAVREEFYSNIFKQAPVGIAIMGDTDYLVSEDFDDVSINPAYEQILGRSKEELKTMNWMQITHPDDIKTDLEYFEQFKNGKRETYSREKRYLRPDGSAVWIDMQISHFNGPSNNPGDHVCIITDITQRKEIEATLKYNSEHVPLTGLYNRSVLEKALDDDASLPLSVKRALISVNLSEMYALGLRYGYHYSQTMLKKVADSLNTLCKEHYTLYNTYEFRFVYYVKGYEDEKELMAFCEEIMKTVSSYLYVHGVSAGIGVLPIDKTIANDTQKLLNKLMNTSEVATKDKRNGSNIVFYNQELNLQISRENKISNEIREISEGIKTDRLYLQFQPIFDIFTNKVCGFEALSRLKSQKLGPIAPLEFIPIAEKTNMIVPFGNIITIQALRFLKRLKQNGYDSISVSINVSTLQMLSDQFADRLLYLITNMDINPENVGIELTESVFATERTEINAVINVLKAAGIKVLIDDFGTGYSSFAREQELNVDCLKIDKSFIDKLMVLNPEDAVTADIISMAHKLGHCVIAEGVEHEEQLQYLKEHGCDRIQGYLIAKPLDEDDALELLQGN